MTSLVATINGKKVYSDKEVQGVINSRINFTDGSWCDVETGQVVNNGPGTISIGSPDGQSETETITKESEANNLVINNLFTTDVEIATHEEPKIVASFTGPASIVKSLIFTDDNGVFRIESEENESGATIIQSRGNHFSQVTSNIVSGGSIVISTQSGSISVGGSGQNSNSKLIIKVPKGINIEITNSNGHIRIGDTFGALRLKLSGAAQAVVGQIGRFRGKFSGSTDIEIANIAGRAEINISGASKINVKNGEIKELEINSSGASNTTITATVFDADIDTSGASQVYVKAVNGSLNKSRSGASTIKIGNR